MGVNYTTGWLWYSEKQREICSILGEILPVARLEDGSESVYTEMTGAGKGPCGTWDDYEFLGKGTFLRVSKFVE